ncbi:hypothetical protein ACFPM3_21365 [Streptomyces coeruleoprunus]|uniref:DUF4190 domain-containing protein n=1 Tax=Streptomyces coeruleoprunus TaxID=285563 RepID=A0ABV9XGZ7_9ACTN
MTPPRTGRFALVTGVGAVVCLACPFLPDVVPPLLRFMPLWGTLPLGLSAVVSGLVTLRSMRDDPRADRRPARAGLALGAAVSTVCVGMVVWGLWALRAYW